MKLYTQVGLGYIDSNPFQPFQGYRMIFHKSNELPSSSDFQLFHDNYQYLRVETTPEVYLIDDEIRKMSIEKRKCYLQHEKKLKYFKIYTKANCEQECLSLTIARKCHCVPFNFISSYSKLNILLDSKVSLAGSQRDKICDETEKLCAAAEERNFSIANECCCLEECESETYRFSAKRQTQ